MLALASITLEVIFNANTSRLIPLYAIGVFLSFTLSQAGMVVRWFKIGKLKPGEETTVAGVKGVTTVLRHDPMWRGKQLLNGVGTVMTFVVMLVFAATKFSDGAWVTVLIIPSLVWIFFRIHKHYKDVGRILSLGGRKVNPVLRELLTVVMVDDVHAGTVQMVEFAMSLNVPWVALHIEDNPDKTALIQSKWRERLGQLNHELTIVPCPYRNMSEVIVNHVQALLDGSPNRFVHVVMGQLLMDSYYEQALHANTSIAFKLALQRMPHVVVTDVAYQIHTAISDDVLSTVAADTAEINAADGASL